MQADRYYEWTGDPGAKTRWLFDKPDAQWWAFAGIWDRAETAEGVFESSPSSPSKPAPTAVTSTTVSR